MASKESNEYNEITSPDSPDGSEILSDDSDSEYSINCNICDKNFSGYIPFKQHLESQQHLKQLRKDKLTTKLKKDIKGARGIKELDIQNEDDSVIPEPFAVCSVCNKSFSGAESYQLHIESKKHKKKLKENEIIEKMKASNAGIIQNHEEHEVSSDDVVPLNEKLLQKIKGESVDEASMEDISYNCKECKKVFSGATPYFQHLVSPVHARKMKQIRYMKKYRQEIEERNKMEDKKKTSSFVDACPTRKPYLDDECLKSEHSSSLSTEEQKLSKLKLSENANKNEEDSNSDSKLEKDKSPDIVQDKSKNKFSFKKSIINPIKDVYSE